MSLIINPKILISKQKLTFKKKIESREFILKSRLNKNVYKILLKKKLVKFRNEIFIDLFLKKIFSILIYTGKKIKAIKIFLNWIEFLKFSFVKKFKFKNNKYNKKLFYFNLYKTIFVNRVHRIICPKIGYQSFFQKAVLNKMPGVIKHNYKDKDKIYGTVSIWIKKSIAVRKEKTFILKFYSELSDINLKKGSSYKQKIEYYKTLYSNRKFYKFKKWI